MSLIGFGDVPSQPSNLILVSSTYNSISFNWIKPSSLLAVTGYLFKKEEANGDFKTIYNGLNNPVTSFTLNNLIRGQ